VRTLVVDGSALFIELELEHTTRPVGPTIAVLAMFAKTFVR